VGVLALVRIGYGRFLDSNGRVTLVGLIWFIALYGCVCAVSAAAWRAAFGTEPPAVVASLFSAGALGFWLSPLAFWVADAVRGDGTLRWARLKASPAVVLTWGGGVGVLLPLTHGGPDLLAQRAEVGVLSAAGAYVGLRLLDRVALLHAGVGLAGAAGTGWSAWHALGLLTASLHRAHLAGHLAGVRADRLPAWIAVGAVATGTLITAAQHVWSRRRALRRLARCEPPAHAIASNGSPEPNLDQAEFLQRAGEGADKVRLRHMRRAEEAERGAQAEREVAGVVAELATRGWSLKASVFIEGEPIGDIDILATGPSGRRYAIDVKSTDCTVEYDAVREELVLRYGDRRWHPRMLAIAREQARVLEEHGYGPVQPVLSFTRAAIACARVVEGVVIIASNALLTWLEVTDAQACAAAFTEVGQG
jgi:hypothetical protein